MMVDKKDHDKLFPGGMRERNIERYLDQYYLNQLESNRRHNEFPSRVATKIKEIDK